MLIKSELSVTKPFPPFVTAGGSPPRFPVKAWKLPPAADDPAAEVELAAGGTDDTVVVEVEVGAALTVTVTVAAPSVIR
jgi:hypothetical protein